MPEMNLVLVPGLWLDGDSWSEVTRSLEAAGHTAHPVTLPGLESRDADRSGITLQDHIDAVIGIVDSLPDPVALVGHSGGGAIVYGVVDARPDRIVRAIYVDTGPLGNGGSIAPDLPAVNSEIPLPDWSMFEEEEVADEEADEEARGAAGPTLRMWRPSPARLMLVRVKMSQPMPRKMAPKICVLFCGRPFQTRRPRLPRARTIPGSG